MTFSFFPTILQHCKQKQVFLISQLTKEMSFEKLTVWPFNILDMLMHLI